LTSKDHTALSTRGNVPVHEAGRQRQPLLHVMRDGRQSGGR
jgi:hypothetical protein